MTDAAKLIPDRKHDKLAKFFAYFSNTTRLAIVDKMACSNNCEQDIYEVDGLSRFTVGMNLKYLKKYNLIKGSLTSKNISYCLNYEKLEEFKTLFDEFYSKVTENKYKVNAENVICSNPKK